MSSLLLQSSYRLRCCGGVMTTRCLGRRRRRSSIQSQEARSLSSSSTTEDRVITKIDGNTGIAHVILNRPDKLNALDIHMFRSLKDAAVELQSNIQNVRVVILRGHGRAFCTGLDVKSIVRNNPIATSNELLQRRARPSSSPSSPEKTISDDDDEGEQEILNLDDAAVSATTNLAQDVGYLWRQLPVPVICSLHGMCFGGGLQIALGADIRYAAESCKLSVMESKWGLIPDMSATVTLRELMRIDVAKELTFTGRIVTGKEAAELGLVTKCIEGVDDPLPAVEQLAESLVQKSPDALRLSKQLYQQTWVNASEEFCLKLETEYQKKLLLSWNQIAATARSSLGWKLPYFQKRRLDDDIPKPKA